MEDNKRNMILLADDDEDDQEFLTLAFRKANANHQFCVANNGQEVLDILSTLPDGQLPCLIVLDLNMPVLDGSQTLEALEARPEYRRIPKVIFTTSASALDRERCLAKGATDYLVKPSNMSEFVKKVQTMLAYC